MKSHSLPAVNLSYNENIQHPDRSPLKQAVGTRKRDDLLTSEWIFKTKIKFALLAGNIKGFEVPFKMWSIVRMVEILRCDTKR